jgi:hypothetical protein
MDNLIRARNGQLFLHVDINNLQAQVISEVTGAVQGGQTLNNTNSQTTTNQTVTTDTRSSAGLSHVIAGTLGLVGAATNMAVRPFTFSVTPRRNDQLTFGSVPQTDDSDLYKQYLKFLNAQAGQSLEGVTQYKLVFGDDVKSVVKKQPGQILLAGPPPNKRDSESTRNNIHYYVPDTLRKWNGDIYYVPFGFRQAYFELCLSLTGRVTLKPKPEKAGKKAFEIESLPRKNETPEQKELKIIQQKINSLPQQ